MGPNRESSSIIHISAIYVDVCTICYYHQTMPQGIYKARSYIYTTSLKPSIHSYLSTSNAVALLCGR